MGMAATAPFSTFAQQSASETKSFDIAPQSISQAIGEFTRQSGKRVEWKGDAAGQTALVRGSMTGEQALAQLLVGSGWQAVQKGDGYLLVPVSNTRAGALVTAPLSVEGRMSSQDFQSKTAYSQRDLQSIPSSNGHITGLLRLNPAVQVDSGATSSNRPGDLEPANISIHGAPFWQNLFMVDGMSVNNDINPGNTNYSLVNASSTELNGSTSQGIALDIDLVERVDVYDSNVPAEYGGFNGGVIDAVTRMPTQGFHGSLSVLHTQDAWAKYNIDEWKEAEFYDTPAIADGYVRNQPEFETSIWRLNLEGHVTENFGLIGSFTRKRSNIFNQRMLNESMAEGGASLKAFTDVYRQIDNYFVKGVWTPNDRFMLETVVNHEPHQSEHFNRNALNGDFTMDGGGTNVGMTATWDGDRVVQTHKLNWSELEHSRTGGPGWFARWRHSEEINWGEPRPNGLALYGTFGDLHQEQETVGYQGKFEWSPVQAFGAVHRFALGVGVSRTEASYERKEDFTDQGIPALRPTRTCVDANGVLDARHCSTSPLTFPGSMPASSGFRPGDGQYARTVDLYKAGRFTVEQNSWSVWAEDDMRLGRARIRPGLRIDGDDYMSKTTVAPRLAVEYDVASDQSSQVIAGANRYYGRNIFDYALRVGRETLEYTMSRGPDLVWSEPVRSALNTTVLGDLDIPYEDEWMVGFRQEAWNTSFELKYVNRRGRDQIVAVESTEPLADPTIDPRGYYTYQNIGRSNTDNVSLTIRPLQQLTWAGTETSAQLIANWYDGDRSHRSYESRGEDYIIQYEGKFITWNQRPVDSYNRPWSVRLFTQTQVPAANLTIGSFLNWRGPFETAMYTDGSTEYEDRTVDVYARRRYGTSMTWDLRVGWEKVIGVKDETVFSNLDVTNVLNRRNVAQHIDDWAGAYEEYEMGRQFQLQVGYRF